MREFVNKHGTSVIIVALVLAGLIWWFFGSHTKSPNLSQAFFVDEETGEEMILPLNEYPPRINPKTGKATLVEEIKFTCDGGKTAKVAYYLKYAEGAKKQLEKYFAENGKPSGTDVTNSTFVRPPTKGSKWETMGSTEAGAFTVIRCSEGDEIESVLPN